MLINIAEGLLESIRRELVSSLAKTEDEFLNFIEFEEGDIPESIHQELHNAGCVLYALNDKKASQATAILVEALKSKGGAKKAQEQDELIDLFLSLQKHVDGLSLNYNSLEIDSVLSHFDSGQSYQWSGDDVAVLNQGQKLLQKLAADNSLESESWQKVYKLCTLLLAKCQSKEVYELLWKSQLVAVSSIKSELNLDKEDETTFIQQLGYFFKVIAELGEGKTTLSKGAELASHLDKILVDVDLKSDNIQITFKPPAVSLKAAGAGNKLLFSISKSTIESISFLVKKEIAVCKSLFENFLLADSSDLKAIRADIISSLKQIHATFKLLGNYSAVELVANSIEIIEKLKPEADPKANEFAKNIVLIENILWELDFQKQEQTEFASSTEEYMAQASAIFVSSCQRSVSGLAVQFFAKSLDEIIAKKSLKDIDFFSKAEILHHLGSSLSLFSESKGTQLLKKTEQAFLFLVNEDEAKKDKRVLLNALLDLLISYQMLFESYQVSLVLENRSFELTGRNLQKLLAVIEFDENKVSQASYQQQTAELADIDESVLKEDAINDEAEDLTDDSADSPLATGDYGFDGPDLPVFAQSSIEQAMAAKSDIQSVKSDDIDEEVFDIFLDEAKLIEGELSAHLPTLQQEIFSESVQTEIRRAFHTLKGSGRMVGLNVFGEYAWQHEELLNKLLAGSYSANTAIAEQIESAVETLRKTLANNPFKEDRALLLNEAAKAELLRRMLLGEDIPQQSKPASAGDELTEQVDTASQGVEAAASEAESTLSDSDIQRIAAEISKQKSQNLSDSLSSIAAHEALSSESASDDDLRLENQLKDKPAEQAGTEDSQADPSKSLPDNLQKFLDEAGPEIASSKKNFGDWRSSRYQSQISLSSLQENISNINRSSSESNYQDGEKLSKAVGKALTDFSEKRVEATDTTTEPVKTAIDDLERMHADLADGGEGKLNNSLFEQLWDSISEPGKSTETEVEPPKADDLGLEAQLRDKPSEPAESQDLEADPSQSLPKNLQRFLQETAPQIEESQKNFGDWRSSEYQSEASLSSLQENISSINKSSAESEYEDGQTLTEAVSKTLSDFANKRIEATDTSTEVVKDALNDLQRMHADLASGGVGNASGEVLAQLQSAAAEDLTPGTASEGSEATAEALTPELAAKRADSLDKLNKIADTAKLLANFDEFSQQDMAATLHALSNIARDSLPKDSQEILESIDDIQSKIEGDWSSMFTQSMANEVADALKSAVNEQASAAEKQQAKSRLDEISNAFAEQTIENTSDAISMVQQAKAMHSQSLSFFDEWDKDDYAYGKALENLAGQSKSIESFFKENEEFSAVEPVTDKTAQALDHVAKQRRTPAKQVVSVIRQALSEVSNMLDQFEAGDWDSQADSQVLDSLDNIISTLKSSYDSLKDGLAGEADGHEAGEFEGDSVESETAAGEAGISEGSAKASGRPSDWMPEKLKQFIDEVSPQLDASKANMGDWEGSDYTDDNSLSGLQDNISNVNKSSANAGYEDGESLTSAMGQALNQFASKQVAANTETTAPVKDALSDLERMHSDIMQGGDGELDATTLSSLLAHNESVAQGADGEAVDSDVFGQTVSGPFGEYGQSDADGSGASVQWASPKLQSFFEATTPAISSLRSNMDDWVASDYKNESSLAGLQDNISNVNKRSSEAEYEDAEALSDAMGEAFDLFADKQIEATDKTTEPVKDALSDLERMHADIGKGGQGNLNQSTFFNLASQNERVRQNAENIYGEAVSGPFGNYGGGEISGEASAEASGRPIRWASPKLQSFFETATPAISSLRSNMDDWVASDYTNESSLAGLQDNISNVNKRSSEAEYDDAEALSDAMSEAFSQFANKQVEATDESTAPVKDALSDLERMHSEISEGGQGHLDESVLSSLAQHNENVVIRYASAESPATSGQISADAAINASEQVLPAQASAEAYNGELPSAKKASTDPLDKLKKIADTAQLLANFDEFSQEDMGATLNALSGVAHDGLPQDSQDILDSIEELQSKIEGDWKSNFTQNMAKEVADALATAVDPNASSEEKRQAKEKLDEINNAFGEKAIENTSDAIEHVKQAKAMHSQSMSLFDEWDRQDYEHGQALQGLVENTQSMEQFFKENQEFSAVEPVTERTTEALGHVTQQQGRPTTRVVTVIKQALSEVSSMLDEFAEGNWEARASDEVLQSLNNIISTLKLSYDSLKEQMHDGLSETSFDSDGFAGEATLDSDGREDIYGETVSGPFGNYGGSEVSTEAGAEAGGRAIRWASPKLQSFFEATTPAISSLRSNMDEWVASDYKNESSLAGLQDNISNVNKRSSEAEYGDAEALSDAMSEAFSQFANNQVEATDESTAPVKDALSDLERMHSEIAEGGEGHLDESVLSNLAQHNENVVIRYASGQSSAANGQAPADTAASASEQMFSEGASSDATANGELLAGAEDFDATSFDEPLTPEQAVRQTPQQDFPYPRANFSGQGPASQKASNLSDSLAEAAKAKSAFSQQQIDNLVEGLYDIESSIDERQAPSWSWEMSSALESMLQTYGNLQVPPNYTDLKKINQALEAITQPGKFDEIEANTLINDLMNCRANIDKRKQLSENERYFNNSVARYLEESFYDYSNWQDSDFLAEEPLSSLRQNVQEIESTAKETHFNDVENLSNSMGLMLDRVKSEKVRPNDQVTGAISNALNSVEKTVDNVGQGLGGAVPKNVASELTDAIFSADIGQPISEYEALQKAKREEASGDEAESALGVDTLDLNAAPVEDTSEAVDGEMQAQSATELNEEADISPFAGLAGTTEESEVAETALENETAADSQLEKLAEDSEEAFADEAALADDSATADEDNTQIRLDEKTYEKLLRFANNIEPSVKASSQNFSDWKAADYDFNDDFSALKSNVADINSEAKQSEFSEAESISSNIGEVMQRLEQNKAKPNERASSGIEQGINEIQGAVDDIHAEKMPNIAESVITDLDDLLDEEFFASQVDEASAEITDDIETTAETTTDTASAVETADTDNADDIDVSDELATTENISDEVETEALADSELTDDELINDSEFYNEFSQGQTDEFDDRKFNDPSQLDQTILEIFLNEARDILESNRNSLGIWSQNKNNLAALHEIQRGMHTLKGGSRMAELTIFGDLAHYLESLLDLLVAGRINNKPEAQQILTQGMDLSDAIVSTATMGRLIYEDEKFVHRLLKFIESETGVPSEVESRDTAVASVKSDKPRVKQATKQKASYSVRIQSDLIEKLVNLVGEDVITRARIDRNNNQHEFQLTELAKATDRLAEQMRRLDNETEAQILFRREALSDENEEFDPLELDRFSEIQQLSRSLTETILDLQNIKGSLIGYVEDSKVLLSDQANIQHEVQKELLSATLVRFDSIRTRIERIVEQVSKELGKDVSIQIYGGQVEIERNMLEDLLPGFEHTIRNALVHGIELPEDRDIKGKPRQGKIRIGVRREGAEIWFVIADDGAGADHSKIRDKAKKLGILDESKADDKSYLLSLMFEQGLSTAQKTTQVAGRGIGLDVLREVVNARQGSIEVETERDKGMAISIRMPFTLSVTDALIVKTGQFTYAIPMVSVEGVGRISHNELMDFINGEEVYHRYGQYKYRLYSLSGYLDPYFERQSTGTFGPPVLLIRIGNERLALEISEIMGRQEILIKSVNSQITGVPGIIGATILDDGSPVGVLEVATLARQLMAFMQSGANIKDYVSEMGTLDTHRQKRILVVDDSITMRKITCKILEKYDVETRTAKDGLEAVDVLLDWTPDLILLDIEMPRMDGFELATHVRNEDTLAGLPIIMITSRTGEKHRKRAEAIGVNGYLGKPYTEEILIESIEAVLGQSLRI